MSTSPQPRIALVAFSSLGDGLIYLMMAENLRRNGFAVTYFGNIGYQLRAWLPQFAICPYPALDELDAARRDFIDHQCAVLQHKKLDAQHAHILQAFCYRFSSCQRLLGLG